MKKRVIPERVVTTYDKEDYEMYRMMMTPQKAADLLAYIERGYIPDYNFTGSESDFEYYTLHMALNYAIKKLKETEL